MISVFISYARADGSEAAVSVEKELDSAEFKVWRDKRNLDPFNDFSVEIERAINAADVVVVLVTPSISQSPDWACLAMWPNPKSWKSKPGPRLRN